MDIHSPACGALTHTFKAQPGQRHQFPQSCSQHGSLHAQHVPGRQAAEATHLQTLLCNSETNSESYFCNSPELKARFIWVTAESETLQIIFKTCMQTCFPMVWFYLIFATTLLKECVFLSLLNINHRESWGRRDWLAQSHTRIKRELGFKPTPSEEAKSCALPTLHNTASQVRQAARGGKETTERLEWKGSTSMLTHVNTLQRGWG